MGAVWHALTSPPAVRAVDRGDLGALRHDGVRRHLHRALSLRTGLSPLGRHSREFVTIDVRCCRGDWDQPKSEASNATIAVNRRVIERIHRLRVLTVEVCGGAPKAKAVRKYRVVKKDGPTDLVFQSVKTGQPMRDNNILSRTSNRPRVSSVWIG